MTTQQLLNFTQRQLEKATEKELREVVSNLRSTSRKRYERIEKSGVYSEAVKALKDRAYKNFDYVLPTVAGMDKITLINEYKRYKAFLSSKTSTLSGARKSNKTKRETVSDITGVELSDEDTVEVLQLYDEAKKSNVGGVLDYKKVMNTTEEVYKEHPYWSENEILSEVESRLIKAYEKEHSPKAIYPSKSM